MDSFRGVKCHKVEYKPAIFDIFISEGGVFKRLCQQP